MCDRPALEIEVTPEMIEAGAAVIADYDPMFEGPRELAADIYIAMTAASRGVGVAECLSLVERGIDV